MGSNYYYGILPKPEQILYTFQKARFLAMLNPKLKTGAFSIGGACKHSWNALASSVKNSIYGLLLALPILSSMACVRITVFTYSTTQDVK